MIINIFHNNQDYKIDTKISFDISIPYNFNGAQPNFYDVNPGQLKPFKSGGIIYSVAAGSGCNVPEISMNIHCSGTHTEFVGHLLANTGDVGILLKDILIPAVLITVDPNLFASVKESYHCDVNNNEFVVSRESVQNEVKKWEAHQARTLIIRTTPNTEDKKYYRYTQNIPPFFTNDALRYIIDSDIEHLVVDLPSIDRM